MKTHNHNKPTQYNTLEGQPATGLPEGLLACSEEQCRALLESPARLLAAGLISQATSLRDTMVLGLLYGGGLRAGEMVTVCYGDIDWPGARVRVRGSMSMTRVCPLLPVAVAAMERYRDTVLRDVPREDRVFALLGQGSQRQQHAEPAGTIQRIVKRYADQAGLPRSISPSSLRHLYAAHWIQSGACPRTVRGFLGVSNVGATISKQ